MPQWRRHSDLTRLMMLCTALLMNVATSSVAVAQTFSVIHYFTGGLDGNYPGATMILDRAGRLYGTTVMGGIQNQNCVEGGCGVVFRMSGSGSNWVFNPLFSFPGNLSLGITPAAPLTFGPDGALYGTTQGGPACFEGCGVVFRLAPPLNSCHTVLCPWSETVIYTFHGGTDGIEPQSSGVVFDPAGNMYGTTALGGANGKGVVYKLTRNGSQWVESILYNFNGAGDGSNPLAGVILDSVGNLYGTTQMGGDLSCDFSQGCGTVFELSPSGSGWTENTIYTFESSSDVGTNPIAGLVFDTSGNLYGSDGYRNGQVDSAVWELQHGNGGWTPSVLTYLLGNGGPHSALTIDAQGNLYGTTEKGGAHFEGSVFKLSPQGGAWTYTDLHDFHIDDGWVPVGGVTLGPNGTLYGTAAQGGTGSCFDGCGVVWQITP